VAEPQQSASSRQTSPVGRHPLGGWQTKTPVGPNGRHERLQHSPPHGGSAPPSYMPPHTSPAFLQLPAPVAGATAQRPSAAPSALLHAPPQHSASDAHVSPVWLQNEGARHDPSLQKCEQHSLWSVQGLPADLHVVLKGVHLPFEHVPPQHSSFCVQSAPSAMHRCAQAPPTHATEQHSVAVVQAAPAGLHLAELTMHSLVAVSHFTEQQSRSAAHFAPAGAQTVVPLASDGSPNAPELPASLSGERLVSLPHPAKPSARDSDAADTMAIDAMKRPAMTRASSGRAASTPASFVDHAECIGSRPGK
jgi:hypothetical protein